MQYTSLDSGLASEKSDVHLNTSTNSKHVLSKKNSCIPRPVSVTSPSSCASSTTSDACSPRLNARMVIRSASNCSKLADLTYKNYARDQLIHLIQQMDNENSIIKRQLESKLTLDSFFFWLNWVQLDLRTFWFWKSV